MSEYISTYSTLYLYSVNTFVLYICKTKSYVKREAVQIITALLLIYDYLYEIAKQSYYFIIILSQ